MCEAGLNSRRNVLKESRVLDAIITCISGVQAHASLAEIL